MNNGAKTKYIVELHIFNYVLYQYMYMDFFPGN